MTLEARDAIENIIVIIVFILFEQNVAVVAPAGLNSEFKEGRYRRLPPTAHKIDFSHKTGYNTRSEMEPKTAA
jgi:hypothetical protein